MDTNMNNPLVSVIMPAYNAAGSVRRAVASVLAQREVLMELIVVEDGSRDDTWAVLRAYEADPRVILLKNEANLGIQKSLNRGLKTARGQFIARIDADDEWLGTDKLARQVEFLQAHPDYVAVGTGAVVCDAGGRELFRYYKPETDGEIRRTLLGQNCFLHPSVVMSHAALAEVGGYDETPATRHVEDYDLWLRLGQRGKLANLPLFALRYTISDTQIGALHYRGQFRKNFALICKYRHQYPGFVKALVRNAARLVYFGYLKRKSA